VIGLRGVTKDEPFQGQEYHIMTVRQGNGLLVTALLFLLAVVLGVLAAAFLPDILERLL